MRRILLLLVVVTASIAPLRSALAQTDCSLPLVNTLIFAEAAVSRPAINSPSEIPLSNIYSQLSQATKPQFVYAEAGPQFAGVFEALTPPGSPEPPRAVSAYPSADIPDEDEEVWGGVSRTKVSSLSAFATSAGQSLGGAGDATADSSRSWVTSIVECSTITVIAGWEANNVTITPGSTIEQLGQQVTLVVGPDGSSSDVKSTVVGAEGFSEVPADGRQTDPFSDPIADNDGPRIDVGTPRTSADETGASASGGGFNFLFLDPEAGQGAGYRIGSINAQIDVLGVLEPETLSAAVEPVRAPPTTQAAPVGPLPKPPPPPQTPEPQAVSGTPPAPSPVAVAAVQEVALSTSLSDITVDSRTWLPVIVFFGSLLLFAQVTAAIRIGRRWDPTLDWIVRRGDRATARFASVYLKW